MWPRLVIFLRFLRFDSSYGVLELGYLANEGVASPIEDME